MSISSRQCKAARALLDLTQAELAGLAKVNVNTLVDFENGTRATHPRTIEAIQRALEQAGIEFIEENGGGPGLREKRRPGN